MKIETKNPSGYWTKEKCHEESIKFNSRSEFRRNGYAYQAARRNGWLDDICSHMIETKKQRGYYTKKKCHEEALKYNSKNDFGNNCRSAYTACLRNNWFDDVCSHMSGRTYKPHGYRTKEKCHEEALKYSSRKEFGDKSSHPYTISLNNNWMDDICSHMKIIGNLHKRCIYVYEFSDNHAYIGLTYNFDIRHKEHLECERSIVRKHTETNSSYELKQLTKYIDVDKAKLLEGKYVEKYKKSGWLILNKIKTGGIGGGNLKWTKERCHEEALKYFSKIDYKNHCPQYRKVKEKGWLDDIWSHMKDDLNKTNGYWTKEKCQEEALKYSTRNEFFKKSSGVYNKCQKRKWIDDVCFHMSGKRYKPHGYWTKEKCQEESLKYETKKDFKRNSLSVYSICVQNKWIEELCSHMK